MFEVIDFAEKRLRATVRLGQVAQGAFTYTATLPFNRSCR